MSLLATKEQERVNETSLVISCVTAAVAVVAGGGRVAEQAGLGGNADCGEWWPGWPERYACQHEGPPYPG